MPAPFSTRQPSHARQVTRFSAAARARAGGVLGLAALLVGSGMLCRAAWAQPPEGASYAGRGVLPPLSLPEQFQQLKRTIGALDVTQPAAAIAEYQAFYEEKGFQDAQVTAGVTSVIAQIWWRELKNKDKALEVYDWAIARLGQDPWAERLRQEREQVAAGTLALSLAPVTLPDVAGAKAGATVAPVNLFIASLSQTEGAGAARMRAIQAPFSANKAADRVLVGVDVLATPDKALGAGAALSLAPVAAPSVTGQAGAVTLPSAVVNTGRGEKWSATLPLPVGSALQIGPSSRSVPSLVGAVGTGDVSLMPGQGAAALKNIAAVNEKSLLTTTVVAQIAGGTLSAEQAWQNGSLTLDGVYDFFEHQVNPWGEIEGQSDNSLRLSLAGVLVNHGGERLQEVSKVPLPVRVWLADYFQNQKDARVLTWGESVLSELKVPQGEAQERLAFQAIERMGWFYRDQGQYEKGAQNWLRLLTLVSPGSSSQPDAMLEAARLYTAAGQSREARELYARVDQSDNGHFRGMALYDQASQLIDKQPAQARDLVLQKMPNLENAADRAGPLWALAQAQWKLEQWPEAETTLQEMIRSVPLDSNSPSLNIIKEAAQTRLLLMQQWKDKAFVLPLQKLLSRRDAEGAYHATLYVHSFLPQPVEVKFADASVHLNALTQLRQQRTDSGVLVTVYDLSYSTSHSDEVLMASVEVKNKPEATQQIELRQSE